MSDEYGTGFSAANNRNCRQLYLTFPKESYGYSLNSSDHENSFREDSPETMEPYIINENADNILNRNALLL